MSTINVQCVDQVLTITNSPVIASGDFGVDRVQFSFCSAWDGFTKTAVFWKDEDHVYDMTLNDNACVIPHEVLEKDGMLYFGVFGVDENENKRTSEILRYRIVKGVITENLIDTDPTPEIYQQILAHVAVADVALEEVRDLSDYVDEQIEEQNQKIDQMGVAAFERRVSALETGQGTLADLETTEKTNLVGAVNELFTSVSDGKATVAAAITDKGVETSPSATFEVMASNIEDIETGSPLTITVHAETGSAITAQKGETVVSGTAVNDVCVLEVSEAGTWTVNVTKDGTTVTDTVTVVSNYECNVLFDPVFANNSWAKIISACQNNTVPSTWAIGNQKTMEINGRNYTIDIIGKNRDTYTAGGTAPLTFQMHDCYEAKYRFDVANGTSNGWKTSEMRVTTIPTIFELLPSEIKTAIKEVNKKSEFKDNSTVSDVTLAEKLFLLAEGEVFEGISGYTQYDYYYNGSSKIKKVASTAFGWYLRTVSDLHTTSYHMANSVNSEGEHGENTYFTNPLGVAFAFCF